MATTFDNVIQYTHQKMVADAFNGIGKCEKRKNIRKNKIIKIKKKRIEKNFGKERLW